MTSHWSLSDSMCPKVSGTLLSFQFDQSLFPDLGNRPKRPQQQLVSLPPSWCTASLVAWQGPSIFSLSLIFPLWSARTAKFIRLRVHFLLISTRFGFPAKIIIIIIIIIILFWEFFTPALADGFSLESEWPQVSSSDQDSSQNFGHS